jgi:hypothetical protein
VTRPCVSCGRCGACPNTAGRHGVAQHFQHRKSACSSHWHLKSSKSVETIGGHSSAGKRSFSRTAPQGCRPDCRAYPPQALQASSLKTRACRPHGLLDHLGRLEEERGGDGQAERLGRLEVDDEIEGRGSLNGQIPRLGPFEDLVYIDGGPLLELARAITKGHEPPSLGRFPPGAHGGKPVCDGEVHDGSAVTVQQTISIDVERLGTMFDDGGKGAVQLVGMAYRHELELQAEGPGGRLETGAIEGKERIGRIAEEHDAGDLRQRGLQEL